MNKEFDPAGKVDLSELDALASNDAAGATPAVVAVSMITVLSINVITSCYTVARGSKK